MDKQKTLAVAKAFDDLYQNDYHKGIDELRLHKLMYFAQREALMETDYSLFGGAIKAWRFGPVVLAVRGIMKRKGLPKVQDAVSEEAMNLIRTVYERYKELTSFELSNLTHEEYSWLNARQGLEEDEDGHEVIPVDSIRIDALSARLELELNQELGHELNQELDNALEHEMHLKLDNETNEEFPNNLPGGKADDK